MPRGGKRSNAGRRKNAAEQPASAPTKNLASKILDGLGKPNGHPLPTKDNPGAGCRCEECLWKRDAEAPGVEGQWARKYLWDRRDGKAVSTVNHLHDKPIEHNITVSLADSIQKARKRAQQR